MATPIPQPTHESLLPSENGDKAKPVEAAMTPDSTGLMATQAQESFSPFQSTQNPHSMRREGLMATPIPQPSHASLLPSPHPGLDPGSPVIAGDSCFRGNEEQFRGNEEQFRGNEEQFCRNEGQFHRNEEQFRRNEEPVKVAMTPDSQSVTIQIRVTIPFKKVQTGFSANSIVPPLFALPGGHRSACFPSGSSIRRRI